MTKAYYSTIFQQPAPEIWKIIRDFNNYPVWVGGAGESRIEDGKPGEAVGCVRDVLYQGRRIRQRLLALSDVERTQIYEFCGTPVDGGRAFVEWQADFDCEPDRRAELSTTLEGWFAKWLESLRAHLEGPSVTPAPEEPDSGSEKPKIGLVYRLWLRDWRILGDFEPFAAIAFADSIWHTTPVAGSTHRRRQRFLRMRV